MQKLVIILVLALLISCAPTNYEEKIGDSKEQSNLQRCLQVFDDPQNDNLCYYEAAIAEKNTGLCDKIEGQYRSICLDEMAFTLKDASLCNQIDGTDLPAPLTIEKCKAEAQGINPCDQFLSPEESKELCGYISESSWLNSYFNLTPHYKSELRNLGDVEGLAGNCKVDPITFGYGNKIEADHLTIDSFLDENAYFNDFEKNVEMANQYLPSGAKEHLVKEVLEVANKKALKMTILDESDKIIQKFIFFQSQENTVWFISLDRADRCSRDPLLAMAERLAPRLP